MKTKLLSFATLALALTTLPSHAELYHIFKAAVVLPVQLEAVNTKSDVLIVKKTLGTSDLVNLALGRPLNTKLNNETEVLALAHNIGDPLVNRLIVYNTKTDSIVADIGVTASVPELQYTERAKAETEKGSGIAIITFHATTQGDPSKNGFLTASTLYGSAKGSWTPTPQGPIFALNAIALFGPLNFKVTNAANESTTYDGVVVQGMLQTMGVALKHHLWIN